MNKVISPIILVILCLTTASTNAYELTNLTRNDPYSFYTTRYRYEFLMDGYRHNEFTGTQDRKEQFRFTATPFRVSATDKIVVNPIDTSIPTIPTFPTNIRGCPAGRNDIKRKVPLGDINGRLNMLALFYDQLEGCATPNTTPQDRKNCPSVQYFNFTGQPNATTNVFNNFIFPEGVETFTIQFDETQQETITTTCIPELIDPDNADILHAKDPLSVDRLGFFSIPLDYKKHGIRFDLDFTANEYLDLEFNFGFAEIKQNVKQLIDLSCFTDTDSCGGTELTSCFLSGTSCTCLVYLEDFLMRKVTQVAQELDLGIDDFTIIGFEDIRLGLHLHNTFSACPDESGIPLYLFTPFILIEGSIPAADKINSRILTALPLGNNGHGAFGFTAGFNFDYYDMLSVGIDAGMTHFTSRAYPNVPVPTQNLQSVFYPFSADTCIQPGNNWHLSAGIQQTQFFSNLSVFIQYLYVNHSEDSIVITRDLRPTIPLIATKQEEFEALGGFASLPPFLPRILERNSKWDFQALMIGFNYDCCDNLGLGFLWQAPLSGRRAYDVTNLVFSFTAVF